MRPCVFAVTGSFGHKVHIVWPFLETENDDFGATTSLVWKFDGCCRSLQKEDERKRNNFSFRIMDIWPANLVASVIRLRLVLPCPHEFCGCLWHIKILQIRSIPCVAFGSLKTPTLQVASHHQFFLCLLLFSIFIWPHPVASVLSKECMIRAMRGAVRSGFPCYVAPHRTSSLYAEIQNFKTIWSLSAIVSLRAYGNRFFQFLWEEYHGISWYGCFLWSMCGWYEVGVGVSNSIAIWPYMVVDIWWCHAWDTWSCFIPHMDTGRKRDPCACSCQFFRKAQE